MTVVMNAFAGQPVIVGSGLAGLIAALTLAPEPVVLMTRGRLGHGTSSRLAQGGLAASIGPDDGVGQHIADTLSAGDGLCERDIVESIVGAASAIVKTLQRFGVAFDQNKDGGFSLGLEAAHSRHRILHAGGDISGAIIVEALVKAVLVTPSITVFEDAQATRLLTADAAICGVLYRQAGQACVVPTGRVLLATGGLGGLYLATTNPIENFGHGIALAAEAGAVLSDMEFVQFHPTALRSNMQPLALISEAVRGEGALLVDGSGRPLMEGIRDRDLAPRDIVARMVDAEIRRGGACYLDARAALGHRFAARFPGVNQLCLETGVDPARDLIPVMPAAHYHMGGIDVTEKGRSSATGLWAAGEVASTGLHGANRLASNSLLDAACMGIRAAKDMADVAIKPSPHPPIGAANTATGDFGAVRQIASTHLGVMRDEEGLRAALHALLPLAANDQPATAPASVALLMAIFAILRTETRGAHARRDYPQRSAGSKRQKMTWVQAIEIAGGYADHEYFSAIRSA